MKSPVATALVRRLTSKAKKSADIGKPNLVDAPGLKPETDTMKDFPVKNPFGGKKPFNGK